VRGFLPFTEETLERYSNPDNDPRGKWQSVSLSVQGGHGTKSQFYQIKTPSGRLVDPPSGLCWRFTKEKLEQLIHDNRISFGPNGENVPRLKLFLSEAKDGLTPHTLWKAEEVGTTDNGKKELLSLFGGVAVFDTVKPIGLIERLIQISTNSKDSDIVLDFFAGSGTTAHAVLDQNKQDGGNRRFILVQLPEPCLPGSEALKGGFNTISEITKERIRRVVEKARNEGTDQLQLESKASNRDQGFRVFKLSSSNFKSWNNENPGDAEKLGKQLEMHVDHILKDRSQDDILYEILLKSGYPLTTEIEILTLAGKKVYSIQDSSFLICLEKSLTLEVIRAIADQKPQRVVCLDEGFTSNDQLKTNAAQTFKSKGVTKFLTV
jgi:adenine-specific DNA-methyltransferase